MPTTVIHLLPGDDRNVYANSSVAESVIVHSGDNLWLRGPAEVVRAWLERALAEVDAIVSTRLLAEEPHAFEPAPVELALGPNVIGPSDLVCRICGGTGHDYLGNRYEPSDGEAVERESFGLRVER